VCLTQSDGGRYTNETKRLYAVLDAHLQDEEYIVGGKLSYADITAQPWFLLPLAAPAIE
jgi:glutathione S-transferase